MINGWGTRIKRFFMPHSLRYQLLSRSLLILSGLLILIGAFQYILMSHFLYKNTATNIMSEIRSVPPPIWLNYDTSQQINSHKNPRFLFNTPVSSIAFVDLNDNVHALTGELYHESVPKLSRNSYQEAFAIEHQNGTYQIIRNSAGHQELLILQPIGTPFHGPGGTAHTTGLVQVSLPVGPLQDVLAQQLTIFFFLGLFALVLGLFTFLPSLRKTLVPLSNMVDTVRRINAGNLDERFEVKKQAQLEIAVLSSSFNDMLERLRISFEAEREAKEKMRQFVANASHELRTPLTSIHGFLEVLLRGAASNPDQLNKSLQSMYGESERMKILVQDLILLARLDREPKLNLQMQPLESIVAEMEPQLRLLAGDRHVVFSISNSLQARFDRDKMKQVLLNLFQNAVQHTDSQSGEILVSLTRELNGIGLIVRDNGTGIPIEHQPHIFTRFYRVDSARSRKDGGVGLGLSITQSIIESHGGTITCDSTPGKGTAFHVWIPS